MYRINVDEQSPDGSWSQACDPILSDGFSLLALRGEDGVSVHLNVSAQDVAILACHDSLVRRAVLISLPVLLEAEKMNVHGQQVPLCHVIDAEALITGVPKASPAADRPRAGWMDTLRKKLGKK